MGSPSRRSPVFMFLVRLALVAAALVCALIGYSAFQVGRAVTAVSSEPLRDIAAEILPAIIQEPPVRQTGLAGAFARGERINMLLLGYGGAGHDGPFLTDSLMLASIDSHSGAATLISIPRDLWVQFPASKYEVAYQGRVNEAFSVGANRGDRDEGMRHAAATLEPILGVKIDRTVVLDFRAFRTVVDRIGGIDVTVERTFTSLYPLNDNAFIDASWIDVTFKAGPQHMDGETALRFARARYGDGSEGSDFARSARQQKVMLAARDKVVSTGAMGKLLDLLDALKDNVRTDLSLADIRALGDFARTYDDAATVKGALTSQNVLQSYGLRVSDGVASTLQPRIQGWSEVQAYVRRLIDFPETITEDALIRVRARRPAVGEAAVALLGELGLRARFEQAAEEDPLRTLVTGAPSSQTAGFVSSVFATSAVSVGSEVVVRLGSDWSPPRPFAP